MMIPFFTNLTDAKIESWRKVMASWSLTAIPGPLFGLTLNDFDTYARELLPADVIQGLRDLFVTHIYECMDKSGSVHTIWE
jgi:6-phosphogluconate dehydrogenase